MDAQRKAYLIDAASEAQPYPPERLLAHAWLTSNLDDYDDLDWQKRVGPGVTLGPDHTPDIQKMAYQATRRRVDLVAYSHGTATIIELKDHVDLSAVRQALDYAKLWEIAPTAPPVSAIVVVGNTGNAGIVDTGATMGVSVELMAPAPAATRKP